MYLTHVPCLLKVVKSELLPKLDHIEELCNEQHQKYKDLNSVPPSSISEKLEDLRLQKSKLNNQLDSTIQELNEAKKMRCLFQQQTCNTEQAVDKAKQLLNKHIFDVPDAKKEHEVIALSILKELLLSSTSSQYLSEHLLYYNSPISGVLWSSGLRRLTGDAKVKGLNPDTALISFGKIFTCTCHSPPRC